MNNDEWIHVSPFTGRTSSLPGTDYFNSCCKASINLETPWLLATNEVTVAGSSPGGRAPENITIGRRGLLALIAEANSRPLQPGI